MFGLGKDKNSTETSAGPRLPEFGYLADSEIYLDSACQSMRPQPVIDALNEYYRAYNACGGRVKYAWGQKVDQAVEDTRRAVLDFLRLPAKDYTVSFTLNTTYGINLLLQQLPAGRFQKVVTSDIEHNSVFLPTMKLAERLGVERLVLARADTGELQYAPEQLSQAIVVVNAVSNIDGRELGNIQQLIDETHSRGGIVIIDAAQAMAHRSELIAGTGADAICFSSHKMYSASLGVIVCRNNLIDSLEYTFVGGGMVSAVKEASFELTPDDRSSRFEAGLQAWGEIIAFGEALKWLQSVKPFGLSKADYIAQLSSQLYEGLKSIDGLAVANARPAPVIAVHAAHVDAHRLSIFLSAAGIMTRSGYFCCHYYLIEKQQSPPLIRFSLGLHNTELDIQAAIKTMQKLVSKG